MNHFDLDWSNFLQRVPAWQALSTAARRKLLDTLNPPGFVQFGELGEQLPALVASGLVAVNGTRAMVALPARGFVRAVHAMDRHRDLFSDPNAHALTRYLQEHFTRAETAALATADRSRSPYEWVDRHQVAQWLSSADWVEDFLALGTPAAAKVWEDQRALGDKRARFGSSGLLAATQRLVQGLASHPAGLPLAELDSRLPEDPAMRADALHAALRYALCYLFLDPVTLEPRVGVWPPIATRLSRPPVGPPRPVEPVETFHAAILMEDMTAVLVAAAGEPLRLRATDLEIFARQQQAIATRLVGMPNWVMATLGESPEERVSVAAAYLRERKLATVAGSEGKDLRLEPSAAGTRWLGRSERERLASLLDPLLQSTRQDSHSVRGGTDVSGFLPGGVAYELSREQIPTRAALVDAFLSLPPGGFVGLAEFLEYHSRERNPLVAQARNPDSAPVGGWYGSRPKTREDWEGLWRRALGTFFHLRLQAFGGVRLGWGPQGVFCFALTDIGRYLLGAAAEFDYGHQAESEVIVQPNFEIVFLAQAPQVEAQLGRLAQRMGASPGVVFRLTRQSILAAAEAGLTVDQVLNSLGQASARELPGNVERQIRDWYGGVRRIRLRHALLIRCPDAETAARVRATCGDGLRRLTSTVLEMDEVDAKAKKALLRRLRKVGVFVEM